MYSINAAIRKLCSSGRVCIIRLVLATPWTRFRHDCSMSDRTLMLSLSVPCCIYWLLHPCCSSVSQRGICWLGKTLAFVCVAVIATQQKLSPWRGMKLRFMQEFPVGNPRKCISINKWWIYSTGNQTRQTFVCSFGTFAVTKAWLSLENMLCMKLKLAW